MKKRGILQSVLSGILALSVVLGLCSFVQPGSAAAKTSSEWKEELEELKKQNETLQDQIDDLEDQRADNLSEIRQIVSQKNAIDQQIALLYEQLENADAQIAAYSRLIADKQEELDAAQAELELLNAQNRARIRAMEAGGTISYWEVLFKATSFSDLLDRLNMIRQIAQADQARIAQMNQVAAEIADVQADLAGEKTEMEAVRARMAETQQNLDISRAEADALLAQLVARGEEYQALIDEGEDAADALMEQIAKTEKEYTDAKKKEEEAAKPKPGGQGGTPNPGGWVTPCSYSRVSSPFSSGRMHPVLGYVRPHNGIDLAAPSGTPIYATRSGTVTTTAYQEYGAGKYVSINHGDGFASIYMHMTRYVVSPGQQVAAGQLIGYVGSTGISSGPHLHFGISYNGKYVNPANYMNF